MTIDPDQTSGPGDKPPAIGPSRFSSEEESPADLGRDPEAIHRDSNDSTPPVSPSIPPTSGEIPPALSSADEVPSAEVVEAEIIPSEVVVADIVDAIAVSQPLIQSQVAAATPPTIPGSPFAAAVPSHLVEAPVAERLEPYTARGAATASLGLGVLALLASFFSTGGLFPAFLGFVMGLWGLASHFRRRALIGLVISIVAVGVRLGVVLLNSMWLRS